MLYLYFNIAAITPNSQPATQANVMHALNYVNDMQANLGGTDLLQPLKAVWRYCYAIKQQCVIITIELIQSRKSLYLMFLLQI